MQKTIEKKLESFVRAELSGIVQLSLIKIYYKTRNLSMRLPFPTGGSFFLKKKKKTHFLKTSSPCVSPLPPAVRFF